MATRTYIVCDICGKKVGDPYKGNLRQYSFCPPCYFEDKTKEVDICGSCYETILSLVKKKKSEE